MNDDFAVVTVARGKSNALKLFLPDHAWAYLGCSSQPGAFRNFVVVRGQYQSGIMLLPGVCTGRVAKVGTVMRGGLRGISVCKRARNIPDSVGLSGVSVPFVRRSKGIRLKPMFGAVREEEVEEANVAPISPAIQVPDTKGASLQDVAAAVRVLNETIEAYGDAAMLSLRHNRVSASVTFQ